MSQTIETDSCRITIESDYGHIEESKVAYQLDTLFSTYDSPTDLIKNIEGSEKATELREEQLYFAEELIGRIDMLLKHAGTHSYKADLVVLVKDVKAAIEQSCFEV